ncbi:pyridoxal-phosphate-dependent aminotransferase family protein [Mucisphaera sp.]|uniref:pyridoxal-phosphate-dependent aminotransferase family protein n=1 Tax=Mucisphaera sp. TaxID=2913024 RepID=UPI003D0FBEF1
MSTAVAPKQRLLTPGPTAVPPEVLAEMAKPIIHHRTKAFQAIFAELSEMLQKLFVTSGPVLSIAGSGTTSYEAAQVSLVKPGSKALTIAGGKFGERWQDVYDTYAKALCVEQVRINVDWGHAVDPAQVEQALKDHPEISVVTLVHSETSTATVSDAKRIAEVVQKTDALLLVDGITSVGAMPVEQDAWGIDVLVTGSQKAMMLPPGLGFVGLGERALRRLDEVQPGPYYNLDLRKWVKSHAKNDVPFTPPVSLIRAQKVACEMILGVGLEATHRRTRLLAEGTRAALKAMGLSLVSHSPSDSVTGAYYPSGVDDSALRAAVRDKHGVHLAGGQDGRGDKWKGRVFRLSHMGYVDAEDTRVALGALEAELSLLGDDFKPEAGTAVRVFDEVVG